MRRKLKQYEIYKISTDRLIERDGSKIKIIPLTITKREALEKCEVVKIQSNQLTNKIFDYFRENNIPHSKLDLSEIIVNVVVPTDAKKQGEKEYGTIAKQGFMMNGKRYVRLYSGSGQIRRNIITFIREDLYEPIFNSLLCGLSLADFGKEFNAAKFNAYCGLNMSGCHLLPDELSPNVCIVDDFEQIRPHNTVNYVTEDEVEYITLPDEDYILYDGQTDFDIENRIATRKSDGKTFSIHKGIKKYITETPYDEIDGSPALNSFDGQGLMSPEWAGRISEHLGLEYTPSALIIRAPWVKGLLANVPFHEWFYEHGISEITDSFGKVRKIVDIDCIISKSQFKMHKVYRTKCERMGINAWDYHTEQMIKNHLLWGIAKLNNAVDDEVKSFNYQYLQALRLDNKNIDELCKPTEDFLQSLNSGDIEAVYNNLMVNGKSYSTDIVDDENDIDESIANSNYKKLFQRVIEANPKFINDKYIREMIFKECQSKFNGAKLGKILVRGNFQFCISDPVAQLEWIARNHCNIDIEVKGVVNAGHTYSNYWMNADEKTDEIVLMRSPLIDRNEIAKRKLIKTSEHYFRYISSGLIYSVHDLTALQQGGCDFDGDISFSTNNPIVLKGSYDYEMAKPLYYELSATDLVGRITPVNMIRADIRGLNSAVGKISNKGGSLYAKLQNYPPESEEYRKIYNSIVALGQVVGMEIDRIKTAVAPTMPLEWTVIQGTKYQNRNFEEFQANTDDEQTGIYRHNELVPDYKPYYFRYSYDYIDKSLRDLSREFNKVCEYTFGFKLSELTERCKNGLGNDAEIQLYEQYRKAYPVIDSDCIVNHICHNFEYFERNIKQSTIAEGQNMLADYVSKHIKLNRALLKQIMIIVDEYKRFKRFMAKTTNTNYKDNKKAKGQKTYEAQNLISVFYREKILELVSGDLQLAFDMLITASKGNEKIVWDIMDSTIIPIISKGCVE